MNLKIQTLPLWLMANPCYLTRSSSLQCIYEKNEEVFLRLCSKTFFHESLKGGFFIEAGAFNGESDSTSLHFELNHGWNGLLVEPHPLQVNKIQKRLLWIKSKTNKTIESESTMAGMACQWSLTLFRLRWKHQPYKNQKNTSSQLSLSKAGAPESVARWATSI